MELKTNENLTLNQYVAPQLDFIVWGEIDVLKSSGGDLDKGEWDKI